MSLTIRYITTANANQMASQMRKEFTLPAGIVDRATAFIALPGFGKVYVNGHAVDGETGTRTLAQWDVRVLYNTYDVTPFLLAGQTNVVAIYVGLGWWGHPAVPPQAKRFPFGPPTLRALLRVSIGGKVTSIGTDATWMETQGPYQDDDIYNGVVYDAREETAGWTDVGFTPNGSAWANVVLASTQKPFALATSVLSSAAFPPVTVVDVRKAEWMRMPSPGVYVFDFGQNGPGWCKLKITGPRGLQIQLRHAELLQHPPYGPKDGNIYVANLRSAKATDVYILRGDPDGEVFEPTFTQHGFRCVAVSPSPPPSLPDHCPLSPEIVTSGICIAGQCGDSIIVALHALPCQGMSSSLEWQSRLRWRCLR
jgi:alpha-L-rhamnosidase